MFKVITILAQTRIFNDDIREWRRQPADLKTRAKYKLFFPPSTQRKEKSVNNRRKRGVHRNITKHLRCTTALSRRAPLVHWRHANNCAGNSNKRIRSGRTGTSQFSAYQLDLRGNGTVGTDDCDHDLHAGATKKIASAKTNQARLKKVLLMELWELFQSRGQNLLSKESGTSRWCVPKKRMGGSEKGCEWRLEAIDNKIKSSIPKISLINHIDAPT